MTKASKILVLDFGSQYSHLIVRRCREVGVYSELLCGNCDVQLIKDFQPSAVILSGGPFSVFDDGAPHADQKFWDFLDSNGLPALGICYGLQEMMCHYGGTVEKSETREFGPAILHPTRVAAVEYGCAAGTSDILFTEIAENENASTLVWMSHGDNVTRLAPGFHGIASTGNANFAAVSCPEKRLWGVQFHPEVTHTADGTKLLSNFILKAAHIVPSWTIERFYHVEVERLRSVVGTAPVIGAVSGGVDSTVAAALMHKAVGSQFHAFFVDNGLLRLNEAQEVAERLRRVIPGMQLDVIDAGEDFLHSLVGVTDPEEKRRRIGNVFVEQFEKEASSLCIKEHQSFLLQGTLYTDVIESVSFKGPSHTIKTHHNVGGLPERMNLRVIEPLRELFKDEVRALGETLGIERSTIWRHPFPGPGLAIRILGEVTRERVAILQKADSIFVEELKLSGDYDKIGQALVVLLPGAMSVGVMGDKRTYEMTAVLRAVATNDYMTADWYPLSPEVTRKCSSRIVNEVRGINRVVYDVTSKPPSTIEWE